MKIKSISKISYHELKRLALESIFADSVPFFGGSIVALGRALKPSKLEEAVNQWQKEITGSVNSLENVVSKLQGSFLLEELPFKVGIHVANESIDGHLDPFEVSKLLTEFNDVNPEELIEACGELEFRGLCSFSQSTNSYGNICPTIEFFETFDPFVHRWHPVFDAANLAIYVADYCKSDQTITAEKMSEHFGWAPRRLNPSLLKIASFIGSGRKFTGYTPPWVCHHLYASSAERAALRDFSNIVLSNKLS